MGQDDSGNSRQNSRTSPGTAFAGAKVSAALIGQQNSHLTSETRAEAPGDDLAPSSEVCYNEYVTKQNCIVLHAVRLARSTTRQESQHTGVLSHIKGSRNNR